MNALAPWRKALLKTTVAALCLTGIVNPTRSAAQDQNQDQEVQMG